MIFLRNLFFVFFLLLYKSNTILNCYIRKSNIENQINMLIKDCARKWFSKLVKTSKTFSSRFHISLGTVADWILVVGPACMFLCNQCVQFEITDSCKDTMEFQTDFFGFTKILICSTPRLNLWEVWVNSLLSPSLHLYYLCRLHQIVL